MAEIWYNRGKTRVFAGDTVLDTGDLRMLFITGTKTGADDPDLDTVADLDAVSGVGIHTERITLTGETVTQDDTNNRVNADVANVTIAPSGGVTILAAVIYDEAGGTDATRHLLTFYDTGFGAGIPIDGGATITINDWARGT